MKKKTYLTDYAIKIFDKAKSNYVTASKIKVRVYQDRDTKEEVLTTEAVCAIEKEYAKQAGRMFCDDIVELRENLGYSQRQFAEELGLNTHDLGVIVLQTARNSPASRLRLRPGDILLRINQHVVERVGDVKKIMSGSAQEWQLAVKRGGQVLKVKIRG